MVVSFFRCCSKSQLLILGVCQFIFSGFWSFKYLQISFFVDGDHHVGFFSLSFFGVESYTLHISINHAIQSLYLGVVAVSMVAVNSFETLLLARFLLGIFQCGFFPAFTYYISLWYCKKEQAFRLGFFWSFSALAGAFGGLIAYAIAQIKSSMFAEWQLIFIVNFTLFFIQWQTILLIDI